MALKRHPSWTLFILLFAILALSVVAGGVRADDDDSCPQGQGYWKNTATWPVTELTLGGQLYTQAELLILFNTPVGGDASLNLTHQLIAAILNVADGDDPVVSSGVIAQANALLAAYPGKLPFNIPSSSSDGLTMVSLGVVLDAYNSGQLTVNCNLTATPEATPEMTPEATPEATPDPDDDDLPITIVIEGPVTAININIITIYNINIELDEDDPNLTIIQIGDIVRVEGDTEDMDGTIVIIVINITIINVDINVDTGEVWRDDGNCGNGPPPWAPAHGWRRRCGDINIDITINGGDDD